jgi:[ribosomal protein S5]-alanine N-acetyltransferase
MFLTKSPARSAFDPILVCDPVYLRTPVLSDHKAWAALREESRAHLIEWEQDWAPEDLSVSSYRRRLRLFERDAKYASGLSLFLFRREDRVLIGGLTLTNIRYGAARAATLGYWIGAPYIRRGYGAAALEAFLPHAIDSLDLNRIEAACQPGNTASQRLLSAAGFDCEGSARDYLKINGYWCDHDLYAITARQFRERENR